MDNLQLQLYQAMVTNIRLGTSRGKSAVHKPVYILAIIDCIELEMLCENRIVLDNKALQSRYQLNFQKYSAMLSQPTLQQFIMPFYFLGSEPFYELVWKTQNRPPMHSHTPSAKYLRENLAYAKLDDDLWELLQDEENRDCMKQAIIDQYLK